MARKKKCTKFGRSHGRKVCRKFSGGRTKHSKRRGRGKMTLPGIGKAISATNRRSCSNPVRTARTMALQNYIKAAASVTINQGAPALGVGRAKQQLRSLARSLKQTYRLQTKCVMQARRAAARAAKVA